MSRIEILAPAGSVDSMKAAVNTGCDAVYMGGAKFGARAYAKNPEDEDLLRAIDYVHIHGKQLYLTVNTLLKKKELENELYEYLHKYYMQGLDAVIVQDVGVMRFLHTHFPKLPIHASTQMTLTMAEGANELKQYGVTRVVPSRELSLIELTRFRKSTDLEIEAFVHGALCYCYSGQCLMSSIIGGRSGNRGRCAQPCRMEYQLEEGGKRISDQQMTYLLSPKDMCTLPMVAQLIEAGINSFKIEGRMKRPEYVAGVVKAYKTQADLYYDLGSSDYKEYLKANPERMRVELRNLQDLYNRGGFHTGYYDLHNGKQMMSMTRPNHSGVLVGHVVAKKGIQAEILLREEVNAQDVLEFRNQGEATYEFTVKTAAGKGEKLITNTKKGSRIELKDEVYRTKNAALLEEISNQYLVEEQKILIRGFLYAKPQELLQLTIEAQIQERIEGTNIKEIVRPISVTVYGEEVMQAQKQPMNAANIEEKIRKTKETPFEFSDVFVELVGETFFPIGKLNELRRNALLAMEQKMAEVYRRKDSQIYQPTNQRLIETRNTPLKILVLVRSMKQLTEVLLSKSVNEIYIDLAEFPMNLVREIGHKIQASNKKCFLLFPHILRAEAYDELMLYKDILDEDTIDGYVLKNFEELAFTKNVLKSKKELRLDYNMYVMNEEAITFYEEQGITHYTASVELNSSELRELTMHQFDLVVYGRLPLMVSTQCLKKNTTQCSQEKKSGCLMIDQPLVLIDRMQAKLPVRTNCKYCYNTIYSSQCMNLLANLSEIQSMNVRGIRMDFSFEEASEVTNILHDVENVLIKQGEVTTGYPNSFQGHYKRGIQ